MSLPDALRNGLSSLKDDFLLGGEEGRHRFYSRFSAYLDDVQISLAELRNPDSKARRPARPHPSDLLRRLVATDCVPNAKMGKRSQPVKSVALLTNQVLDWKSHAPTYGGGERVCLTLAGLLRESGCTVTIYQGAHQPFQGECAGFNVIGLPSHQRFSEFDYGISETFFDISQSYDGVIYNLPEYASAHRMRRDALLLCHGIWFDHRNYEGLGIRSEDWFRHLHRCFAQPGLVVSVDTNSINVVRALWPELATKMVYLPNFADTELFHPEADWPTVGRSAEDLTILFPRRSHVNRGSRILGDILSRIPHRCRILWIGEGDGPDNRIIEALAQQDSRLQFLKASFEQMPDYYRSADICVIPTIACEGTSLSCIESLASGCATVATHIGGLSDIIQSGSNGLLVSPNPESISGAVNYLIEHSAERTRLQLAARQSAQHFDVTQWRKRWLALLSHFGWIPAVEGRSEEALFWL